MHYFYFQKCIDKFTLDHGYIHSNDMEINNFLRWDITQRYQAPKFAKIGL